LLLLTIGIVGSYLVARHFLTPPSFGEFGWYRGDALAEIASANPVYAGIQACQKCHSAQHAKLLQHGHKGLSCEGCHGPGQAHADNPQVKMLREDRLPALRYGLCVRCHQANPSRPRGFKQIDGNNHYPGSKCTECHEPHLPLEVQ
jgi:hypothetical protein